MKNITLFLLALISTVFATTTHASHTRRIFRAFDTTSQTEMGRQFGRSISYPLIADGKVYLTVKNATGYGTMLYALDQTNGATVWSYALGRSFSWSGACYENGRVFAVNGEGLLRAFDGPTGNLIWNVQLPNQYSFSAPPTVYQGVIYVSGAGSGGTSMPLTQILLLGCGPRRVMNGDKSSRAVTIEGA